MKPSIILIVVAAVIVIGVVGYFIFFAGGTGDGIGGSQSTVGGGTAATISQAYPNAPTGTTFSIGTSGGTVLVNNFYAASSTKVGEDGILILAQTSGYWITYDPSNSSFWIAIVGTPFSTTQPAAEQAFLMALGVSKADACKLHAAIGTPYAPGSSANGQSHPLSFCTTQ